MLHINYGTTLRLAHFFNFNKTTFPCQIYYNNFLSGVRCPVCNPVQVVFRASAASPPPARALPGDPNCLVTPPLPQSPPKDTKFVANKCL